MGAGCCSCCSCCGADWPPAPPAEPPTIARSAPTGTVSSSWTRMRVRVPATGEGISVSTLSVETSSSGSSTATSSPSCFSQRVTVPSVTDSPSAGIVTVVPSPAGCCAGCACGAGCSCCWGSACWGSACCGSACGSAGCWPPSSPARATASPSDWSETASLGPESPPEGSAPSPITARSAPTGTVSSSWTRISWRVPATGEGISVSTLSVETSSSGSSTSTRSPTPFSQRVTVPSVTDSPSAGIFTRSDIGTALLRGRWRASL